MSKKKNLKIRKIVTEEELKERIKELSDELVEKIGEDKDNLVIIGILRGGILFVSELSKNLARSGLDPDLEFVVVKKVKEDGKKEIQIVSFPPKSAIEGKTVIVIDDLIKSGETIIKVIEEVKKNFPKRVLSATLVLKENSLIQPDVFGFSSEDTSYWVGYGLAYEGKYRNLPYIGEILEE